MDERIRKVSRYGGYGLLGVLLFFYFSFLTFPYDLVVDRYLARWTRALPYRVSVKNVRATPFLWISARDVRILPMASTGNNPVMEIQEARLRPSWIRLLIGEPAVRIKAALYGGQIKGRTGKGKDEIDLSIQWKDIRLEAVPLRILLPRGQLKGRIRGDLDLRLRKHDHRFMPTNGTLRMHVEDGAAKNLQVRGLSLPALEGITGDAHLNVAQNRLTLKTLSLNTNVLDLMMEGRIDLSPQPRSSLLNLKGKIKLTGAMATQYQPMLAGLLRKQDKEGFYIFSIRGTLENPRLSL